MFTIQVNFVYRSVKTRSEADSNIPDFELVFYIVAMMYPEVQSYRTSRIHFCLLWFVLPDLSTSFL